MITPCHHPAPAEGGGSRGGVADKPGVPRDRGRIHLTLLGDLRCDAPFWVCLLCMVCVCESLGCVQLFATPWTVASQATLSMEFSRQKYWRGHFLLQGSFPAQGSNLGLLHRRQILSCLSHQRSPNIKEEAVITPTSGGCQNDK